MSTDFDPLEGTLGLVFRNRKFLKEALTHRSYLNENPAWDVPHNERLEYLGDAVLELVVSAHLFKKFPEKEEGELTTLRAALVNYQMLAHVAHGLNLHDWIFLSRGEAKDGGRARDVILANALEAVLGAIYLDLEYAAAEIFVSRFILPHLSQVIAAKSYLDPKSSLQELIQEKMKLTPSYHVLKEEGPAHQKRFFVGVFFGENLVAQGDGLSKQEAETAAARSAHNGFKDKGQ